MTLHQAFLFQHVARRPSGVPLVVLANHALTSAAAVTQMVRRMALRGFIDVERDPENGRCRLVTPTAKGYHEYERVFSIAVQQDQLWSGYASRHMRLGGAVSIEGYAQAGLELWRREPEVTGRRYATG
ncbi:MarR family transcriptional regulator [Demequina sp. NBRC 110051]|uniref:MarR family transcriptional regulator n=1 Tax=Demequina sp. NBRC 110051 TaxID=1570340 RepID=UPI0013563A3D|nr:MarR family transcriptional regulator [Demequina sp. NBRC 110051]